MARAFTKAEADALIDAYRKQEQSIQRVYAARDSYRAQTVAMINTVFSDGAQASRITDCLRRRDWSAPWTDGTREFLLTLCRYQLSTLAADYCDGYRRRFAEPIRQALKSLTVGTSSLRWMFSGEQARTEAGKAYAFLKELAAGETPGQLAVCEQNIRRIAELTAAYSDAAMAKDPTPMRDALIGTSADYRTVERRAPEIAELMNTRGKAVEECAAVRDAIREAADACMQQVRSCANRALGGRVMQQLREMDVECLTQVRPGIRAKSLKENGYRSVADVYCAPAYSLASIHGISADSAKTAKEAAAQIAQQVQTGATMRLSADEKTPEASSLITALFRFFMIRGVQQVYRNSVGAPQEELAAHTEALATLRNNFCWIFSTEAEKEKYADAFAALGAAGTDFADSLPTLRARLEDAKAVSPDAAWEAFERDPYLFYNLVDELAPGILGHEDAVYGLPEELAKEIRDETVFPDGLNVSLRRYQEWGVKYILHQGNALLGDEMGLGKTVQAIAAMVSLRNTGATRFLVVCPASVLPNWCKEINGKSEFRAILIHGPNKLPAFEQWRKGGGVGVTSYETVGSLPFPDDFRFDLLVVDEAHYIKNAGAKRSRDLRALAEHVDRLLFMTGTALENRVDEMISLISVLRPDMAKKIQGMSFMATAPQFRKQIAPVYYRRKREDVLKELPEVIETKEWCSLSPAEDAAYKQSVLKRDRTAIRRVSWTQEDLSDSTKARRLKEIIDEAREDGRKVLVFSFYLETIRKIREFLGEICTEPINGSVPVAHRQEIIDGFAEMPAGSVLLAQIQAGGTGLNIQAASVVVICEPQLKPSIENQAIGRAYRMGQVRNVLVYRLLAADTIDERIDELLSDKQAVFEAFADPSVAAEETDAEEKRIDDKTFGKLIQEEIDRINRENGAERPASDEALPAEDESESVCLT